MSTWTLPVLISLVSAGIALVGLLWSMTTTLRGRIPGIQVQLTHVEERCTVLETKISLFWRLIEEHLSQLLKKPIHYELDVLLDKQREGVLTLDEAQALRTLITETYLRNPGSDPSAKIVATLVLWAVEARITELQR